MVWEAILRWCKTAALINGLKLHTGERDGSFKLLHIPPTELIANHTLLSACVCACARVCVCVCLSVCCPALPIGAVAQYKAVMTCHPYAPAGGGSPFGSCVITGCSVTLLSSCCTDATLTGGCVTTAGELGADLAAGKISDFRCGRNFSIRCHDNTHSWYCGVY